MQVIQQADAARVVNHALGLGQGRASHQPRPRVVEAGHGQEIMLRHDLGSQSVNLVGQDLDLSPGSP
ncbi:hypothetical protein D3C87_1654310 [compost metagenome]